MVEIEMKLLRGFVEIARDRSFTRAATRLHMTQPTLSLQIRKLEAHLGIALFKRSTRTVEMTQEGLELLPYAQLLVEQGLRFDGMIQRVRRGGSKNLHLGAAVYTADFVLRNEVIDRYVEDFPQYALNIHADSQNELIAKVQHRQLDAAFVVGMPVARAEYDLLTSGPYPSEGVYPADLKGVVLASKPLQLLVPAESSLSRMASISPAALKGLPLAMFVCSEGRPLLEPIVQLFQQEGANVVYPPEAHVISSVERFARLKRMATVSLGWSHMPHGKTHPADDMVLRPIAVANATTDLVLVVLPDRSVATEALVRIAESLARQSEPPVRPVRVAALAS